MNYYALIYKTVSNYLEERGKYRAEHLKLATDYFERGQMILAGAMDNPADMALLVFKGDTDEVARSFAEQDPYVKNGLISSWEVRKWNVVIGNN